MRGQKKGFRHTPESLAKMSAAHKGNASGSYTYGRLTTRLAPTEWPTILDIVWAAGLYEGEGTCKGHTGTQTVSITQKNTWVLHHMRALFGGSVGKQSEWCSYWQISGARARGFLMSIYGLLSPRRQEQVRKVLVR